MRRHSRLRAVKSIHHPRDGTGLDNTIAPSWLWPSSPNNPPARVRYRSYSPADDVLTTVRPSDIKHRTRSTNIARHSRQHHYVSDLRCALALAPLPDSIGSTWPPSDRTDQPDIPNPHRESYTDPRPYRQSRARRPSPDNPSAPTSGASQRFIPGAALPTNPIEPWWKVGAIKESLPPSDDSQWCRTNCRLFHGNRHNGGAV